MKTFMNSKYSYLMAAAVLAGSMSFTACTNEEEVINPLEGPQSSVTLGLSVAGMGTKANQDDVNLGATMQTIKNIWVAPMVKGGYSYAISLGDFDPATPKACHKTVNMLSTVDQFRVFGNLPSTITKDTKETSSFSKFTYTPEAAGLDGRAEAIKPYSLLYFADTNTDGFLAAKGETWDAAAYSKVQEIGENNLIKIDGVKYKVGVFGLAVLESAAATEELIAYEDASALGEATAVGANAFEVDGVLVSGQAASFNDAGEWSKETKEVYETATAATLAAKKIATAASETASKITLADANVYCVVSPTAESEAVSVNIRFKNVSQKHIKMNDGTVVAPQAYMYIPVTLDPSLATGTGKAVFAEATTTVLNATVKSWGAGSGTPVESTELQLGIEVDMSWTEGLVFDQEI